MTQPNCSSTLSSSRWRLDSRRGQWESHSVKSCGPSGSQDLAFVGIPWLAGPGHFEEPRRCRRGRVAGQRSGIAGHARHEAPFARTRPRFEVAAIGRASLELSGLPDKSLGATSESERVEVASLIGLMTSWPGVGASVATKTLHKKRPALIPILDNMAIFGAYMNPMWPEQRAKADTIKAVPRIKEALDWIAADVTRPENEAAWESLREIEPERTRIELFDMVWWMHFSPLRGGLPSQDGSPGRLPT